LERVRAARSSVEIEAIEVLKHPGRALQERVFMIPAIIVGGQRWYHAPALDEILAALEAE
jgi:hypothetical protein